MQTINGIVQSINPRHGTSKAGKPYTIWSAMIDNTEVEFGFDKPTFNVGDTVSVNAEMNRYNKLAVIQPGKPSGGRKPAGGGGSKGNGYAPKPFPLPLNHGDTAILRQNAVTNANATVAAALNNNVIDAEAYDPEALANLVLDIARRYVGWTSGQED